MKKYVLLSFFFLLIIVTHSQCTTLASAVPGITLVHQNTNCLNNSGVAYNPQLGLYYGVRAGNSTFPLETWTSAGVPLYNTTAGFDWRGMWWNPATNQLEGNGYSTSGIWRANLNGSGYALNTGVSIFTGMNQPDAQSCGDLDYNANEILYYFSGNIYRYSRATNAFLGSYPITGTPVAIANLNSTTLMYTGCAGKEIALLDYVNKRVYLYNKASGAYNSTSQLPAAAVTTASFRTSWANGYVWLFNLANYTWYSYQVLSTPLPVELLTFRGNYEDGKVLLNWVTATEINNDYFTIERSEDGISFTEVIRTPGAGNSNHVIEYNEVDNYPYEGVSYYRLRQVDFDGTAHYSEMISIDIPYGPEINIYPNPATDELFVTGDLDTESEITIVSSSGETLQSGMINHEKIDFSTFPAGMYVVHIKTTKQSVIKRIVVE